MTSREDTSPQMSTRDVLRAELRVAEADHLALDAQIQDAESHPAPDHLALSRLKRRKLAIKDQIARIKDRLFPDIIA